MNENPSGFHPFAAESVVFFEDMLKSGLSLRVKATGKSMVPFLSGGEILTITQVSAASLRTGDLIFFKTREGVPLIHRVVKIKHQKNSLLFLTKGDGVLGVDDIISETDILGKVCSIEKIGSVGATREIDMESHFQQYRNYISAVYSFSKSRFYSAVANMLPLCFRKAIKKISM